MVAVPDRFHGVRQGIEAGGQRDLRRHRPAQPRIQDAVARIEGRMGKRILDPFVAPDRRPAGDVRAGSGGRRHRHQRRRGEIVGQVAALAQMAHQRFGVTLQGAHRDKPFGGVHGAAAAQADHHRDVRQPFGQLEDVRDLGIDGRLGDDGLRRSAAFIKAGDGVARPPAGAGHQRPWPSAQDVADGLLVRPAADDAGRAVEGGSQNQRIVSPATRSRPSGGNAASSSITGSVSAPGTRIMIRRPGSAPAGRSKRCSTIGRI